MKLLAAFLLLLCCGTALSIPPPGFVWVKSYFTEGLSCFYHVELLTGGGYAAVGFKSQGPGMLSDTCLFKFDEAGELLWARGIDDYVWDFGYWVSELSNGSLLLTGSCRDGLSSYGLFLAMFSSSGDHLWTRFYDDPSVSDQGNCVLPLDDGFVIAGDKGNDAWIIRTDLNGDSLWSVTLTGTYYQNARRVLETDDAFIVYINSPDERIVALSKDDGQILWEQDDLPITYQTWNDDYGDITYSGNDNGFTLVTAKYPNLVHTDSFGNVLWYYLIPYATTPYSCSISSTMDGGYIYGGENTTVEPTDVYAGMVVKFDSEGMEQWRDYVYETASVQCIRQLSSGGYIACGYYQNEAVLLRYAPETGIEQPNPDSAVRMDVSPNPCSSLLSVSFDLPEAGNASIRIFDLSGRLVSSVADGQFPAGTNTVEWAVPEYVSSGCYLIQYNSANGTLTDTVALIK